MKKRNNNIKIPDINEFTSPRDIKNMSPNELELTAASIREFLIEKVSKTGGHIASNLGVVEITLGLHYVFDSPKDKIIWDVGHQAYVHKILTGRAKDFDNLRKTDGMSGFPKRHESQHDIYETGHSSTSIAAALGMATARDLKKEDYEIISVIGDGSLTGGPAFEALNNVGHSNSKIVIVLNDNGMSISNNIGGLSEHLSKLRTSTGYLNAKEKVKDALDKVPVVGGGLRSILANTRDNLKYMLISGGVFFEELGLTYLGPYNGNDIKDVIYAFKQAKSLDRPVLVHMITKKGCGYKPAEEDPNRFHGIGAFDPETGNTLKSGKETYSDIFGDALSNLAIRHEDITAITAAMCDATGLGKMQKILPERIFDVGIAEAYGVIFAAGQAISGLHPYVAIYSSFLQRAYDEILEDVCLHRLPVTFAIDRAGVVGADGETHHGIYDLSYLIPMPGMKILAPCDGNQLRAMIDYSYDYDGPCAIRYPRGEAAKDLVNEEFKGENIRICKGKDVDIFAVGNMLSHALEAVDILKNEYGIDAGLVDVAVVKDGEEKPSLDTYLIDKDYDLPKLLVTLEDNVVTGGFGAYLTSLLTEKCIMSSSDVMILGWPDKFIQHGDTSDLFEIYGLNGKGIAKRIADAIKG